MHTFHAFMDIDFRYPTRNILGGRWIYFCRDRWLFEDLDPFGWWVYGCLLCYGFMVGGYANAGISTLESAM
jgi:hypothetical protein